ncbi:MAG: glycosyltransferase family 4 protein [Planctomycetaceae bacterium]|nr:glycosyltransferase family 4 protein [Planctomycetaceae bacterium]
MHVAVIRKVVSLKKAGAERYAVNLSRQLKKLGHRVTVIGESIDEELLDELEFLPVQVRNTTSWAKNQSFARNALAVASRGGFDIVHGLSRVPGVDTFRLTDPLQAHWLKVFYTGLSGRLQGMNPRHRTLLELERGIYQGNRTRRIIVQSSLDAKLIQDYFGVPAEKIRLIRNGVDLQTFHFGTRQSGQDIREELRIGDAPLIVFAGMDFRRKGLGTLLEGMGRIQSKSAKLLVLGDGAIPEYERMANRLGIGDRVIFAGRRQGIARYYGAADLFVLPTIYEPFPNVNLEAMACGTPAITTSTAGGVDLIDEGNNGYLISSATAVEELTNTIDYHLALPSEEIERMRGCCVRTAEAFPVERNARETVAVFEEVLAERKNKRTSQAA